MAKTTISINVTIYSHIIILLIASNSSDVEQYCLVPVASIPTVTSGSWYPISAGRFESSGSKFYGFTRGLNGKTTSSIQVSGGYRESQTYDGHCIPYKIWGINLTF